MAWLGSLLGFLTGCNPLAVEQLRVGSSTRADVLKYMGQPEASRKEASGPMASADVLDYSGQPEGTQNWQIVVGTNDLVLEIRKTLTPDNFAKVYLGMQIEDVRQMLGKPAKVTPYRLAGTTHYDWRYLEPPNQIMLFTVIVDGEQRVRSSQSARDNAQDMRGG